MFAFQPAAGPSRAGEEQAESAAIQLQPLPTTPADPRPSLAPPPYSLNPNDRAEQEKKFISKLDRALMPFLLIMGLCIQKDRLAFTLSKDYFQHTLGFTEMEYQVGPT
ncbi:hypothetical protein AAE478_008154 [Parahypoxylon ruwenzoriense]